MKKPGTDTKQNTPVKQIESVRQKSVNLLASIIVNSTIRKAYETGNQVSKI